MTNLIEKTQHCYGLLVFDYDETNDIFLAIKNRIIIPKRTEIPLTVKKKIYARKNVFQDKVLLKFGVTESLSLEEDPRFVRTIWSELLHLNSNYPTDCPLQIICSLNENQILNGRIINLLNNETICSLGRNL